MRINTIKSVRHTDTKCYAKKPYKNPFEPPMTTLAFEVCNRETLALLLWEGYRAIRTSKNPLRAGSLWQGKKELTAGAPREKPQVASSKRGKYKIHVTTSCSVLGH